jgi:hypothetical protein
VDKQTLGRQIAQDLDKIRQQSDSPVAKALYDFFFHRVLSVKTTDQLASIAIPSLEYIFTEKTTAWTLEVKTNVKLETLTVVITRQQRYYLIYSPKFDRLEESPIEAVFNDFKPQMPRFTLDSRMVALEVNAEETKPVARPVVILTDNEEPMTYGKNGYSLFAPSSPEVMKGIVDKIINILEKGEVIWGDKTISPSPRDIPTY